MSFPTLDESLRQQRLQPPTGKVSLVLDTDTYNEIDDQFAVAHALLSPDRLDVEAIYAAPFHNDRSSGPEDGMERSYDEILRILERLGKSGDDFALKGSRGYLTAPDAPRQSDAAADLVRRALTPREGPLYVVAIGAITNVASALLLNPEIAAHIVVVWLGGHPHSWHSAHEFNLRQDVTAAQVILDCGVPFVQIPCKNVAEHLTTTKAELEAHIAGKNPLCDFLYETFAGYSKDHYAWAKEIWDISVVAWLLDASWVPSVLTPTPILTSQVTWSLDRSRHLMREATHCRRNPIFADLFRKLAAA
ncbi:MAG: nucleoside hydrolase [Gemmatimonadetes bacterium]|jgi:purine nucleosidase|nr:nucleoside hydrolase [Gemmatimonadota bacterium]MBT5060156.1 nucleoside hydrolase [Gemmatimonadota bacterium]MBT5146499.1 nucleoside hydrolase [Gemmatimonadota bacterium]MBT5962125.1 nucleoside hydrolase [Gemmatimonadota bacterium]MBT6627012.1 nucleoside hydrolase [Gemmatimonadota bacterium]